jgi:hypothetical protein
LAKEEAHMSQGDFVIVKNKIELEKRLPFILKRLEGWDYTQPLCVKFEQYDNPRTLSQNALFHIWCKEMSDVFIKKIHDATPEGVKWMMKSKFLGTQDIKVGQTELLNQVRSSSKLTKGEMVYFMDKVYEWASERDVFLSLPQYNEYTELKRKQDK